MAIAHNQLTVNKTVAHAIKSMEQCTFQFSATDGAQLLQHLATSETLPNVLIIDVYLATIDGAMATKYIKLAYPNIKIIGMHTADDDVTITTMLFAGADGYVWQYDLDSIIPHCIQHIDHDPVYLDSRLGLVRLYKLYQQRCNYLNKCAEVIAQYQLTPTEQKFLVLSASHLPYKAIAQLMFVTPKTLHTYFYRLAQKLPVSNRQELTVFSLQYGLSILTNHMTKEAAMLNS